MLLPYRRLHLLINHEEVIIRFHTKICSLPFFWQHGLSQAIWDHRTISLLWGKLYCKQGNWCQLALDYYNGVAGGENGENWGTPPLVCPRSVLTGKKEGPMLIALSAFKRSQRLGYENSQVVGVSKNICSGLLNISEAFGPLGFYEPHCGG